jgi:hypothetical protein
MFSYVQLALFRGLAPARFPRGIRRSVEPKPTSTMNENQTHNLEHTVPFPSHEIKCFVGSLMDPSTHRRACGRRSVVTCCSLHFSPTSGHITRSQRTELRPGRHLRRASRLATWCASKAVSLSLVANLVLMCTRSITFFWYKCGRTNEGRDPLVGAKPSK